MDRRQLLTSVGAAVAGTALALAAPAAALAVVKEKEVQVTAKPATYRLGWLGNVEHISCASLENSFSIAVLCEEGMIGFITNMVDMFDQACAWTIDDIFGDVRTKEGLLLCVHKEDPNEDKLFVGHLLHSLVINGCVFECYKEAEMSYEAISSTDEVNVEIEKVFVDEPVIFTVKEYDAEGITSWRQLKLLKSVEHKLV